MKNLVVRLYESSVWIERIVPRELIKDGWKWLLIIKGTSSFHKYILFCDIFREYEFVKQDLLTQCWALLLRQMTNHKPCMFSLSEI